MKSFKVTLGLVVTLLVSAQSFADSSVANAKFCPGTFSDVDVSVVNEGAVVSYVSPADGKRYVFNYGLIHMGKAWTTMCGINLPQDLPDTLTITFTIPNDQGTPAFDGMSVDTNQPDGKMNPLRVSVSTRIEGPSAVMTAQVVGLKVSMSNLNGGFALITGNIFDVSQNPSTYRGGVLIPLMVSGMNQ